ncbi:MAG: ClbS/DfsB family four-helix bundle protein [Chloroflexi bacterium]|nr:ClbS/DfsB family four-helix bundle protein [Chloroflexota bacterium]
MSVQSYYAQPGPLSTLPDSIAIRTLLEGLPTTIPDLVKVVQNNLLHVFWAKQYGVELTDERKAEVNIRTTAARLQAIYDADPKPLVVPRAAPERSVGNCRDFSLMLVTLLRHQGVPARARCGFATYFMPQHYEDHWVCEYWNADQGRWIQVDAQMDTLQSGKLQLDFDPLDVPLTRFLPGGLAWQKCRQGEANPDQFGIFDMSGLWFVRGDMLRDFAALNKVELLPWDVWGLIEGTDEMISQENLAFLDHIAALTLAGDEVFEEIRTLHKTDDRVRVPAVFKSFDRGPQPSSITLAEIPGIVPAAPENKAELIAVIRERRQELEALITPLDDETLARPDLDGGWSIKDLLAHIAGWERICLGWVRSGQRDNTFKLATPGIAWDGVDTFNAQMHQENRDLSLAEVRARFVSVRAETLAAIESMTEDEIFAAGHYAWTGDEPLLNYLRANSDEHDAEHTIQIAARLAK